MADFKVIETQEQFEEMIMGRIHSAKDSVRKEYEGWMTPEEVEKKIGNLSSENASKDETIQSLTEERDNLKTQIEEKDKSIANYENDSVKRRIANELGLGYEAVDYISGNDEESIRKSAEGLKNIVGNGPSVPLANLGGKPNRGDEPNNENEAYINMLREMRGE